MKNISTSLLAICGFLGVLISSIQAQSLEVRRAQLAFTEDILADRLEDLNEELGFEVPLEFDYESINASENPKAVYESLPGGALHYLAMALAEVAVDDLGKQALQDGVSKILFVHNPDPEAAGVSIDDEKTVTVTMDGNSSTSEIAYSGLKEFLEKNL